MRWDERLEDLFDDLEQQAEGMALVERDAEVAELSRAEYASVDLAGRLHASTGRRLLVTVTGIGPVEARLGRVGSDWCLVDVGAQEWVVPVSAIGSVRGLSRRATSQEARAVTARLGLASALRRLADAGGQVALQRRDGTSTRGTLDRVGADFLDVRAGEDGLGYLETVPFAALAAVRSV